MADRWARNLATSIDIIADVIFPVVLYAYPSYQNLKRNLGLDYGWALGSLPLLFLGLKYKSPTGLLILMTVGQAFNSGLGAGGNFSAMIHRDLKLNVVGLLAFFSVVGALINASVNAPTAAKETIATIETNRYKAQPMGEQQDGANKGTPILSTSLAFRRSDWVKTQATTTHKYLQDNPILQTKNLSNTKVIALAVSGLLSWLPSLLIAMLGYNSIAKTFRLLAGEKLLGSDTPETNPNFLVPAFIFALVGTSGYNYIHRQIIKKQVHSFTSFRGLIKDVKSAFTDVSLWAIPWGCFLIISDYMLFNRSRSSLQSFIHSEFSSSQETANDTAWGAGLLAYLMLEIFKIGCIIPQFKYAFQPWKGLGFYLALPIKSRKNFIRFTSAFFIFGSYTYEGATETFGFKSTFNNALDVIRLTLSLVALCGVGFFSLAFYCLADADNKPASDSTATETSADPETAMVDIQPHEAEGSLALTIR